MHEFSICESIFSALEKECNTLKIRSRVNSINLVIGEMHQVIEENIHSAWEVVVRDTVFAGSTLKITWQPVILLCRDCKSEAPKRGLLFVCPKCGSRETDIISGNELYIENMGVETDG